MLKHWKGLTLFLKDPRIPLDNNAAERILRGPVVGRKNFYGNRSKLNGTDPAVFLREAAKTAIENPGAVILPR